MNEYPKHKNGVYNNVCTMNIPVAYGTAPGVGVQGVVQHHVLQHPCNKDNYLTKIKSAKKKASPKLRANSFLLLLE